MTHLHPNPDITTLVHQYAPLVHAAARRQLPDPTLADDVTQAVFLILARRIHRLPPATILSSWLLKTTHFACCEARRAAARRIKHERKAAAMRHEPTPPPDHETRDLLPHLDAALAKLNDRDRAALTLAYLEQKSVADISALLAINPEAAQKRITRALHRLRNLLRARHPALHEASLSTLLLTQTPAPLPASHLTQLAAPSTAHASSAALSLSQSVLHKMFWIHLKPAIAASVILAAAATGTLIAQQSPPAQLVASSVTAGAPINPLAANLGDVTVDPVFLSRHSKENQEYWHADGSPAERPDFAPFTYESNTPSSVCLALRLTTTAPTPPGVSVDGLGVIWFTMRKQEDAYYQYLDIQKKEPHTTLRLHIATGPWVNSLTAPPGSISNFDNPRRDIFFSLAFAYDRGAAVVITDACPGLQRQATAIDKAGREHTVAIQGNAQSTAVFPNLKPADITDIRYESRPFTHYIQLTDVSLELGHDTRPAVKSGTLCLPLPRNGPPHPQGYVRYSVLGRVSHPGDYGTTINITLAQAILAAGIADDQLSSLELSLINPKDKDHPLTVLDPATLSKDSPPLTDGVILQLHERPRR